MKKFLSVILSIALTASMCANVFAAEAEKEDTEKILLSVKERIGSTDQYEDFTSTSNVNGKNTTYTFRWSSDDKRLNITVNSDMIITSYNKYDGSVKNERKPSLNKMSADDALQKTKKLFGKLNPDIANNIRFEKSTLYENLFENGYSFYLQRTYSGIDVFGNDGYIRVNADASEIESLNLNYTQNLKFEDLSKAISRENAIDNYKKELGMELRYNIKTGKSELEYSPKFYDTYISAISGKAVNPIEPEYRYLGKNEAAMDMTTSTGGGSLQLSVAEEKNMEQISGLLSKEDAEKIIRETKIFAAGDKMTLSHMGTYYNSNAKKYYYSMEFKEGNVSASASVDAQNGDIISYIYYGEDYKTEGMDDENKAKEYAGLLAPKYYKADNSLDFRLEQSGKGNYNFVRYHEDIKCSGDTITLNLNDKGEVTYYSIRYTETEFDSPEGVLSHSEICDRLFENCGYKLYYYPSCSSEELDTADIAMLIYDIENKNSTLNAKTGKIKNEGKEFKVGNYKDIDGHYAEKQIKTLAKFGIGFEGDNFSPDNLITQQDFIALITSAFTGNEAVVLAKDNNTCSYYFTRAVNGGIVTEDEKNPEGSVTREMAAVFMIRTLGLDEVASLEEIFVSKFADVTKNKGYISILNAMGVVNGFGGNFEPTKELTRADAMIMVYNYLSR